MRSRSTCAALATGVAGAAALATALPAAAFPVPGDIRDVREFACPPGQVPDEAFGDVPPGDVYRLNINCLFDYGITAGRTAASGPVAPTFAPREQVTRSEMARFLVRLLEGEAEAPYDDPGTTSFQDIGGEPAEAQRAIRILSDQGITSGRTDTSFAPRSPVTRGQLAKFVTLVHSTIRTGVDNTSTPYAAFVAEDDAFPDDDGSIFEDQIDEIAGAGIVAGFADGTYRERTPVTRAQMAAYLTRYLDLLVEGNPDLGLYARNNETLSQGISLSGSSTAVAVPDSTGAAYSTDDRVYEVQVPFAGVEYRITLVATDAYERRAVPEGSVVFFTADQSAAEPPMPGIAKPDAVGAPVTPARVVAVNGLDLEDSSLPDDAPPPSRSVVADSVNLREGVAGFTFTVDSDAAAQIAPFVYATTPTAYPSYSTFLEVADDLRPVEVFGVGPTLTYLAP